jgi:hypothetical protein
MGSSEALFSLGEGWEEEEPLGGGRGGHHPLHLSMPDVFGGNNNNNNQNESQVSVSGNVCSSHLLDYC